MPVFQAVLNNEQKEGGFTFLVKQIRDFLDNKFIPYPQTFITNGDQHLIENLAAYFLSSSKLHRYV